MAELYTTGMEKIILDSSFFIQIEHTLTGKGVYSFFFFTSTISLRYTFFENNKIYVPG